MLTHIECSEPAPTSRDDYNQRLNRHAAAGTLDDRINLEGSGVAEWLRCTKSNNSLNPTGVSMPFIVNLSLARLCSGGLIRALGAFFLRLNRFRVLIALLDLGFSFPLRFLLKKQKAQCS